MSNTNRDVRKQEKETQAFKKFMRIAKQVQRLEYGKWKVVPDSTDPLRKFALVKSIGLVDIGIVVYLHDFYHRGDYTNSRWDWHECLGVTGLYQVGKDEDGVARTGMKIGPRSAKKILQYINEQTTPRFYQSLAQESARQDDIRGTLDNFSREIAKVKGLRPLNDHNSYDRRPVGDLKGCPMGLRLGVDGVHIEGSVSYDDLAEIAQRMGWGV